MATRSGGGGALASLREDGRARWVRRGEGIGSGGQVCTVSGWPKDR
jgi:hypothetical protein